MAFDWHALDADPVRAFIERTLDEAGFAHLPADVRAEHVAALSAEARRRVGLALAERMDGRDLHDFRALMDEGATDEEAASFLDVRVPNHGALARETLAAFREECLESARRLGASAAAL